MSMKKDYIVHDTFTKSITAIGCSVTRRELYLGFEDGTIRSLEIDTGTLMQTYNIHRGLITCFLYWPTNKLLFCASNDSSISAIGSGGNLIDRIPIGTPVYAMAIWMTKEKDERNMIFLGVDRGIQLHALCETKEGFSHYIETQPHVVIREHEDIVRCLVIGADLRIYSGGFDGVLKFYDYSACLDMRNRRNDRLPVAGEKEKKYFKQVQAHAAGISCMSVERDAVENNLWIFTGSFDKTLKVWGSDGKLVHKFDNFISSVTGLCFLPKSKTICCVAGTNTAYMFDPKSGDEVTDFVDTFANECQEDYYLQILKYFGENNLNVMAASTSRKQLIVFKYQQTGSITSLKYRQSIDSICYTNKAPILMFVGDSSGSVSKWEQRPSNQLIYGCEFLLKTELKKESSTIQGQGKAQERARSSQSKSSLTSNRSSTAGTHRSRTARRFADDEEDKPDPKLYNTATTSSMLNTKAKFLQFKKSNIVFKLLFVETLDIILAACEDGCIYVWGYDLDAIKILKDKRFQETDDGALIELNTGLGKSAVANDDPQNIEDYYPTGQAAANVDDDDKDVISSTASENKTVTNRVAGFVLKAILNEHTSSVSCLVVVERPDLYGKSLYLLSGGWDRRICLWDLNHTRLCSVFQNKGVATSFEEVELASDGNILDMCYCEKFNYFAYASTDKMCYIRKFDESGTNMTLVNTLQGHLNDVNCIRWNPVTDQWITGGEDCTLRIWSTGCECLQIINCSSQVNSIALDLSERVIITACHDTIKIYDMDEHHLLQTSIGHRDSIREVIFIPERNHIVSVSWDKTIKIWRFIRKTQSKFKKVEKTKKFETRLLEEMKQALKRQVSFHLEDYSAQLGLNTLKMEDTLSSEAAADFQSDKQ